LVVAPASLLENWERELALWCPRLRVVTYHGAHKEMVRNQLEKWRYDVSTGAGAGRAHYRDESLLEQLAFYIGAGFLYAVLHAVWFAQAWLLQ
jgi:SWI/SNF-related matrix-associated actin-dependent regulator 1 of chromatin subfamily A